MCANKVHDKTSILLARANDDYDTATLSGLPETAFGQHVQAAIEKFFKALLWELSNSFPYSHDLELLAGLLTKAGEDIPSLPIRLAQLTDYAMEIRYEDISQFEPLDRQICLSAIEIIRSFVKARVTQLNS